MSRSDLASAVERLAEAELTSATMGALALAKEHELTVHQCFQRRDGWWCASFSRRGTLMKPLPTTTVYRFGIGPNFSQALLLGLLKVARDRVWARSTRTADDDLDPFATGAAVHLDEQDDDPLDRNSFLHSDAAETDVERFDSGSEPSHTGSEADLIG